LFVKLIGAADAAVVESSTAFQSQSVRLPVSVGVDPFHSEIVCVLAKIHALSCVRTLAIRPGHTAAIEMVPA
jgi:hypothetical protein